MEKNQIEELKKQVLALRAAIEGLAKVCGFKVRFCKDENEYSYIEIKNRKKGAKNGTNDSCKK